MLLGNSFSFEAEVYGFMIAVELSNINLGGTCFGLRLILFTWLCYSETIQIKFYGDLEADGLELSNFSELSQFFQSLFLNVPWQ